MAFAKLVEALVQLPSFLEAQRSLLDADVFAQIRRPKRRAFCSNLGILVAHVAVMLPVALQAVSQSGGTH